MKLTNNCSLIIIIFLARIHFEMSFLLLIMSSICVSILLFNTSKFLITLGSIWLWALIIGNLLCLLGDHFSGYFHTNLFCSIFPYRNSFSHSESLLWLFPVSQMLLQNLLLSSALDFLLLLTFPSSCWYTLFWSCWNNYIYYYDNFYYHCYHYYFFTD